MDSQKRYEYDPETCSFVEVEQTWAEWGTQVGQVVGLALVLAGLLVWAVDAAWLATPEERTLRVENQALKRQLSEASGKMGRLSARLDTLAERDRRLYRRLFQIEPISEDVRQVGVGGSSPGRGGATGRLEASTVSLLETTARQLDRLERQMALQGASYRELTEAAGKRARRLRELPAIRPAEGPIVSGYGMRRHPVLEVRKMHAGVDVLLRPGTPVVATGEGTVRRVSRGSAYGIRVDVRHGSAGYLTRYAHLSEVAGGLDRGAQVQRGDTLGYSGNTGRTSGPHLHYEVRRLEGKDALDPMRFFVPDMTPRDYQRLAKRTRSDNTQLAHARGAE